MSLCTQAGILKCTGMFGELVTYLSMVSSNPHLASGHLPQCHGFMMRL